MPADRVTELGNRRMCGLDRAFEIFDFLRERGRPLRPNEIAVGIEAPKATAHELVNILLKAAAVHLPAASSCMPGSTWLYRSSDAYRGMPKSLLAQPLDAAIHRKCLACMRRKP